MNFFEENYTYLDAPVKDVWTNMEGSTNDIGALFIKMGTAGSTHEFTVRSGEFTDDFMQESANRIMDRLVKYMVSAASEGAITIETAGTETEELAPVLVTKDAAEVDGDYQKLDLSGSWYFEYRGANQIVDIEGLGASDYHEWSVVEAGAANWTKGYGNISEENVDASYGEDYFDYFITGNGYYVKEFELPEAFNSKEMVLSIGYIDDRCEVFVNGERVGLTGMDKALGMPTGDTTWAEYSIFEFDGSILKYDEVNTVVVRAYNDGPYGAGGWYEGPIYLASKAAEKGTGQTSGQSAGGTVQFEAKAGVEELYNVIPSSSYTGEVKAELSVPVIIEVVQDEKVISAQIEGENVVNSENLSTAYSYDFTKYVDEAKGYEIVLKAAVFDKEVVLDTVAIE